MEDTLNHPARLAIERAIEALAERDPDDARIAITQALDSQPSASLHRLADAVHVAASEIEDNQEVSSATWDQLADTVSSGPLLELVEQMRG